MSDTLTPSQRSRCMAAIRSKNTTPERLVRQMVHAMGYRFRLHVKDLPGTPDIVLPRHRKIIEVRGCFWHRHHCAGFTLPVNRRAYWRAKFRRNQMRDAENLRRLRRLGYQVLTIWECQLKNTENASRRIRGFLG